MNPLRLLCITVAFLWCCCYCCTFVKGLELEFTTVQDVSGLPQHLLLAREKGQQQTAGGGVVCLDGIGRPVLRNLELICSSMGYDPGNSKIAYGAIGVEKEHLLLINGGYGVQVGSLSCAAGASAISSTQCSISTTSSCNFDRALWLDCNRPHVAWTFSVSQLVSNMPLLLAKRANEPSWRSVCDDGLNYETVKTLCRLSSPGSSCKKLFYASLFYADTPETVGLLVPAIGLDEVVCPASGVTDFSRNCTYSSDAHDCATLEAVLLFADGAPLLSSFGSHGVPLLRPHVEGAVFPSGLGHAIPPASNAAEICRLLPVAADACRKRSTPSMSTVGYASFDCQSSAASFSECDYETLSYPQYNAPALSLSVADYYSDASGKGHYTFNVRIEPGGLVLVTSGGPQKPVTSSICNSDGLASVMLCRKSGYHAATASSVLTFFSRSVPLHRSYNASGVFDALSCPDGASDFSHCAWSWSQIPSRSCIDGANIHISCNGEGFHPELRPTEPQHQQQNTNIFFKDRSHHISIPVVGAVSNTTAAMVCSMSGYEVKKSDIGSFPFTFGTGSTDSRFHRYVFSDLNCPTVVDLQSPLTSLSLNCTYTRRSLFASDEFAVISCPRRASSGFAVKLEDNNNSSSSGTSSNSNKSSGFVLVRLPGTSNHFGAVCERGLTQRAAVFLCSQAMMPTSRFDRNRVQFSRVGPRNKHLMANRSIFMEELSCDVNATDISECNYSTPVRYSSSSCHAHEAVWLDCDAPPNPFSFRIDEDSGLLLGTASSVGQEGPVCVTHSTVGPSGVQNQGEFVSEATAAALCGHVFPALPRAQLRPFAYVRGLNFHYARRFASEPAAIVLPLRACSAADDFSSCHFQSNLRHRQRFFPNGTISDPLAEMQFCSSIGAVLLSCGAPAVTNERPVVFSSRVISGTLQFAPLTLAPASTMSLRWYTNFARDEIVAANGGAASAAAAAAAVREVIAVACSVAGFESVNTSEVASDFDQSHTTITGGPLFRSLSGCSSINGSNSSSSSSNNFQQSCSDYSFATETAPAQIVRPAGVGIITSSMCGRGSLAKWKFRVDGSGGRNRLLATAPGMAGRAFPEGEVYWSSQASASRLAAAYCATLNGSGVLAAGYATQSRDLAACWWSCPAGATDIATQCSFSSSICDMATSESIFPLVRVVTVRCSSSSGSPQQQSTGTTVPWITHASSFPAPTTSTTSTTSTTTTAKALTPSPPLTFVPTTHAPIQDPASKGGAATPSSSSFDDVAVPVLSALISLIAVCIFCIICKKMCGHGSAGIKVKRRSGGDNDDDDSNGQQAMLNLALNDAHAAAMVVAGAGAQQQPQSPQQLSSSATGPADDSGLNNRRFDPEEFTNSKSAAFEAAKQADPDADPNAAALSAAVAPPPAPLPAAAAAAATNSFPPPPIAIAMPPSNGPAIATTTAPAVLEVRVEQPLQPLDLSDL